MEYSNILIHLLYQMAYADGKFDETEKAFITQVMSEQGFSAESFIEKKADIPKDERDRMTILYYLLFIIKIDGKVKPEERKFAEKFGVLLGFRTEMVSRMLNAMENHLDTKLPDEELITIIRQYLN